MTDLPLFDYARSHNQSTIPRAPARIIPGNIPFDSLPDDAKQIFRFLRNRIGKTMGVTAADIATALDILPDRRRDRRGDYVRRLINQHKLNAGFVIVADPANGFYRPASAEELSHFDAAMHSRFREMYATLRATRLAAIKEGWQRTGKHTWSSPADR